MRKNIFLTSLLLFSLQWIQGNAQTETLYSTDNLRSNNLINYIYQDSHNYIWIATEDGIIKYDGKKFTIYRNEKGNRQSLKSNSVRSLFENGKGHFWIGNVNDLMTYDANKAIKTKIYPPWYLTLVAKIIFALFIILLLYRAIRYNSNKTRNRKELLKREQNEQINEGKLQFFVNISHEIRTPMTLILDPLEKLLTDTSNPERNQTYQLMYRNAQRVFRLINQLLDLGKMDNGQMFVKMRETNIVGFIDDIIETFEYQTTRKEISLHFIHNQPELKAWIDMNNFDKVLVNVLANALKFTPEKGEITVTLSEGRDETTNTPLKHYFEISVLDNGIGIEEDKIEKIFERFYQADQSQKNINSGTGIGLHLSRTLVELQHGVIFARNRKDTSGSEFIIRVPMGHEHLTDLEKDTLEFDKNTPINHSTNENLINYEISKVDEIKTKPKTKYRVLIVDNEPEIRHYIKQTLADAYYVYECSNGKEALDFILKEKPDLVISDVIMPEMDGFTLCKKMKANNNINHIPMVILTAKASDEDKIEGYEIGADAYITKPFNSDLMKKRIASIIGNRERLEQKKVDNEEYKTLIKPVVLKSNDQVLLEKIMKIVNENISNSELNVEMLAVGVGMSRVHMHRKLKELTDMSARDFIKSIRMKQAAELLSSQKIGISELTYALGFSNLSHFSKSFHEYYGMSPRDYAHLNNEKIDNTQ